jgi:DNA (cytosine-5)-methyltransferase 1
LVDLFCGAGGATKGYQRAGFFVVGVDIAPQPRYCGDEFWQADALDGRDGLGPWVLGGFDAIHASPSCQASSAMRHMWNAREHDELIPEVRTMLAGSGLPYVIENVVGAKLRNPVTICGAGLGLGLDSHDLARHRLFECSFPAMVPPCAHGKLPVLGVYGDHARDRRRSTSIGNGQYAAKLGLEMAREAMGIDWMNWREISQAIPPAYTEHIGSYLMTEVERCSGVAA